ncbi:MAG TPA: NADH-quinone oxidoreductase subunit N [bacterium]|nr:NADH-quinone oxidoreductase subunit N [bacterium]
MSSVDFTALMPLLIISVSSVIILLNVAMKRNHFVSFLLSLIGLAVAFVSLWSAGTVAPRQVTPLLIIDTYALFFMGLIFVASIVVAILTYNYLRYHEGAKDEIYIVLMLAVLGSGVLVSSTHFASFFLGLEVLTISLYVMIAFLRSSEFPLEAGIKYLILAAASSAFLLLGMALLYGELGTLQFADLADRIASGPGENSLFVLTGTALLLTGAGFKLAVVPFHMWTPDVYEGAPAPVTAFIATVSKGGIVALLLRYFLLTSGYSLNTVLIAIGFIAVASMFVGNYLALMQENVKRLLAYSSIAHLGYLLVAFVAGGALAVEAISYYLVVYFITTLGAFGIVSLLAETGSEKTSIEDYRGLFWSRPWIAAAFTAVMLSLAGIPLTAGFVGKFFVVTAGVSAAQYGLVILLVVNSAIALYYYLRLVVAMLSSPDGEEAPVLPGISLSGKLLLVGLTGALIYFGVYPSPLVQLIRDMMAAVL